MKTKGYVVLKPFEAFGSSFEVGEVIEELDAAIADSLVAAGTIAVGGEDAPADEAPADEAPVDDMKNFAKSLKKQIQEDVTATVKEVMSKTVGQSNRPTQVGVVPAQVKEPVFKSLGELMRCMYNAEKRHKKDARNRLMAYEEELRVKVPSGLYESSNADGGYAVNPQFFNDIFSRPHGQVDLLSKCDEVSASSNILKVPCVSEQSLEQGSIFGGITIASEVEGNPLSATKPQLTQLTLTLLKYYAYVPLTNELVSDQSYPLDQKVQQWVRDAFVFRMNQLMVTGSSQPTGVTSAEGVVTVNAEGGQAAGTITFANLVNLWRAIYPECQPNTEWYVSPAGYAQLQRAPFVSGGATPAWGIGYDPRNDGVMTIFGRPVNVCFACSEVGESADIFVADFKQVCYFNKPMQVSFSEHALFGNDSVVYRFTRRLDAKPYWTSTVQGTNGSDEYGWCAVLESRNS